MSIAAPPEVVGTVATAVLEMTTEPPRTGVPTAVTALSAAPASTSAWVIVLVPTIVRDSPGLSVPGVEPGLQVYVGPASYGCSSVKPDSGTVTVTFPVLVTVLVQVIVSPTAPAPDRAPSVTVVSCGA